jgi:hypothetical protein
MSWKTTLALLVLVAVGAWVLYPQHLPQALDLTPTPPPPDDLGTRAALAKIDAGRIERIVVRKGDRETDLRRRPGGAWVMPGNWPARAAEANALAALLADIHTRFEPEPTPTDVDLARKGLLPPALTVEVTARAMPEPWRQAAAAASEVTAAGRAEPWAVAVAAAVAEEDTRSAAAGPVESWRMELGEAPSGDEGAGQARPTYLRLNGLREAVRLAPGLLAQLDRPPDYYQQRRLFPGDRVASDNNPAEKVERLAARAVAVEDRSQPDKPTPPVRLVRKDDSWELQWTPAGRGRPLRDRPDARARDALLAAVPDVWAERFVTLDPRAVLAAAALARGGPCPELSAAAGAAFWGSRPGLLAWAGLDAPRREFTVTRKDGSPVTLLIGRRSVGRVRKVPRPLPPEVPPGVQVREELMGEVTDEYDYARLKDNDQVFEIRDDKLKDVFVPVATLRDTRVAPFETADARRVEIAWGGEKIVLKKDRERWKLVEPVAAEAEAAKVTELLGKLSSLQARDADLIDAADPKAYGLDRPAATVDVTVMEEVKDDKGEKSKKERTLRVKVGKHDAAAKKLYLMVDDWPRLNAVEDDLDALVRRPALAYRGKRLFDFFSQDLAKVEVTRGGETYTLEHDRDGWRLTRPVTATADVLKADQLAGSLSTAEALEFVDESPRPQDLDSKYGLGKPELVVRLEFTKDDSKERPARTLEVGRHRPNGSPGRFARLAEPGRTGPVFVLPDDVASALDRGSLAYRPSQLWQVPAEEVTAVRVRRQGEREYRLTRTGGIWRVAGPFDAPARAASVYALLTDLASPQAVEYKVHEAKDLAPFGLDRPFLAVTVATRDGKEHTLFVGKPAGRDGRYARLGAEKAVFVVVDAVARAADRPALSLLDPVLLRLDAARVQRVQARSGAASLTLEHQGDAWRVTGAPGSPYDADADAAASVMKTLSDLRAERFAAYGPAVSWAKYGLDHPAAHVIVSVTGAGGALSSHEIELGGPAEGGHGGRHARVDHGPGVAVLPAEAATALTRTPLDYVRRKLLSFDPEAVTSLRRQAGGETLEVVRKDAGWQVIKPADERADDRLLRELLGRLSDLHAVRIAAYPAGELHPFGLDTPTAVVTLHLGDGRPAEHVLRIGKSAGGKDHFVRVDDGPAVAVLAGDLAERLLAPPLAFRDRAVAHFNDADRVRVDRGPRRATFARVEGAWKLTEPFAADAEHDELEDFVATLGRLRADTLVAHKPAAAELRRYGLEHPEAHWRLYQGEKEVLDLQVGAAEEGGPRRYARVAGNGLVFLLDASLSARATGEFRTRAVWTPSLDAAQVDALHFGYARSPFTLQRFDGEWQVVGRPELVPNAQTVNDTLGAVANLKLARYAADAGGDPKLFGLDRPELVLELNTPTGKRTLEVGGREGGTRRRYARVRGDRHGGVFVLDAADCARILRDAAAFTRPLPEGADARPAR